jgi:hypothetical protein
MRFSEIVRVVMNDCIKGGIRARFIHASHSGPKMTSLTRLTFMQGGKTLYCDSTCQKWENARSDCCLLPF